MPSPPPTSPCASTRGSATGRRGVPMVAALLFAAAPWPLPRDPAGRRAGPRLAACGSFQALVNAAPSGGTITSCLHLPRGRDDQQAPDPERERRVVDGQNVRTHGISVTATTSPSTAYGHPGQDDPYVGAVWTTGASRFTFRTGVARDSTTVCLSSTGAGSSDLDSELTGCGQEGFFTNGVSATVFSGNRIHHNHLGLAFAGLGEAGGGKARASSGDLRRQRGRLQPRSGHLVRQRRPT